MSWALALLRERPCAGFPERFRPMHHGAESMPSAGLTLLDSNENAYGPSPQVVEKIRSALGSGEPVSLQKI